MSLSQDIKHKTIELGFDIVGLTDASPIDTEQAGILADWLESGFAGQMSYMHRHLDKRFDPGKLLENAITRRRYKHRESYLSRAVESPLMPNTKTTTRS